MGRRAQVISNMLVSISNRVVLSRQSDRMRLIEYLLYVHFNT